jgi:hypothetical protein
MTDDAYPKDLNPCYYDDDEWRKIQRSVRNQKYRHNNKDADIEHSRIYRQNNKDKFRAYKSAARTKPWENKPFVALDSEGRDVLGNAVEWNEVPYEGHQIFLWGASKADEAPQWLVHPETTDRVKKALDPLDVLNWLTGLPEKHGDVNFVMFSFGYDVIHILKHLRFEKAWQIFKNERYHKDKAQRKKLKGAIFCGRPFDQFAMRYLHRKKFEIWKLRNPDAPFKRDEAGNLILDKKGAPELDAIAHIAIHDAYPFFQQGFAKAAKVLVTMGKAKAEDMAFVEEMKAARGRFADVDMKTIKRYTTFELQYLADIMNVLRTTLAEIKLSSAPDMKPIHLKDWYGPGPVAKALLANLDIVKKHYGPNIHSEHPGPIQMAAHHAMAGGRIELLQYGYAPDADLHAYDISSAYPYGISIQPSLTGGKWRNEKSIFQYSNLAELKEMVEQTSSVSTFKLEYDLPLYEQFSSNAWETIHIPFYPLFFRSHTGAVFFPSRGDGWYMRDEVLGAIKWLERFVPVERWKDGRPNTKQWEIKNTVFRVKERWIFKPRDENEKPFEFMNELYLQRLEYKRAQPYDVREKFYKLPLNSFYGKMAQKVGGTETAFGSAPPPTANPYYAAAVTANCRYRLMEAALIDPHSIVAFMTDGIVSKRRLHGMENGLSNVVAEGGESKLGDWEYAPVKGATFLHAGVYSMKKMDEGKFNQVTKTRGLDPKRASPDDNMASLLTTQAVKSMSVVYDPDLPTPIFIPIRNLVTIGMALSAAENNRSLWKRGLAGRWSPEVTDPNGLNRAIDCDNPGGKRRWIKGREADWQTTKERLANRVGSLIPTIPALNPEPRGTLSAIYKPDWVDPEFGEEIDLGEEQSDINDGI